MSEVPIDAAGAQDFAGTSWHSLARAAASAQPMDAGTARRQLLCVEFGAAPYALPVERVREIVRLRKITPVPRAPEWMRGVIALRGEVVQVIDPRLRLQLPLTMPTRRSCIVVVRGVDGDAAGILVDAVCAVLRPPESAFRQAPAADEGVVAELCLHGGEFISVFDVDRILEADARQ